MGEGRDEAQDLNTRRQNSCLATHTNSGSSLTGSRDSS